MVCVATGPEQAKYRCDTRVPLATGQEPSASMVVVTQLYVRHAVQLLHLMA